MEIEMALKHVMLAREAGISLSLGGGRVLKGGGARDGRAVYRFCISIHSEEKGAREGGREAPLF